MWISLLGKETIEEQHHILNMKPPELYLMLWMGWFNQFICIHFWLYFFKEKKLLSLLTVVLLKKATEWICQNNFVTKTIHSILKTFTIYITGIKTYYLQTNALTFISVSAIVPLDIFLGNFELRITIPPLSSSFLKLELEALKLTFLLPPLLEQPSCHITFLALLRYKYHIKAINN